jgi:DNA-binding CsgD family transcriptional regulator/tetratricopeptide (TPR) repeat protein
MSPASPTTCGPIAGRSRSRWHAPAPADWFPSQVPDDAPTRDLEVEGEIRHLLRLLGNEHQLSSARDLVQGILGGTSTSSHRDAALAGALTALGVIACDEGRLADAICLLRAAEERGASEPRAALRPFAQLTLARVLGAVGDVEAADAVALTATADLEANHDVAWTAGLAAVRARNHLAAGRLDDAEAFARTAMDSTASGLEDFERPARATLAAVGLLRGELDDAARCVADLAPNATVRALGVDDAIVGWLQARVCEARGGTAAAREAARPLYGSVHADRRLFVEEPGCAPWLVRLALRAGDRRHAVTVVDSIRILAINNATFPSVSAAAKHAQGLLNTDVSLLVDAASAHVHPWNRASAAEDAGVALVARGAHRYGRAQLERAVEMYAQIGALRDAARIRTRLCAMDRRRRPRRAGAPTFGWEGLTDTERRVAELVAEGLTNRQVAAQMFLSRHTVDFHLRQAFRKLNVQSRVQLTRLALERLQPTGPA